MVRGERTGKVGPALVGLGGVDVTAPGTKVNESDGRCLWRNFVDGFCTVRKVVSLLISRDCAVIVAVDTAVGSIDKGRTVEVSESKDNEDGGRSSGTVAVAERQRGLKLLRCCRTGGEREKVSKEGLLPSIEAVDLCRPTRTE
jgi:hypothetical protein